MMTTSFEKWQVVECLARLAKGKLKPQKIGYLEANYLQSVFWSQNFEEKKSGFL